MSSLTYQKAGVNPVKAAGIISQFVNWQKNRPKDPNLLSGIGPYASCYSLKDFKHYENPTLVTSCDGVGTKLKLALDWNHIENLGHDLVGMNVNDLFCLGAKPLLFLDYYACGKLNQKQLSTLLKSIQVACEESGCTLAGGETAEMPGLYQKNDFDLAGFVVGICEQNNIIGPAKVKAGDILIGIESSGFHSNGYSLVRKIVSQKKIPGNKKWKEALLAPTLLYSKKLAATLPHIHAAAHITGGGLLENLPRVLPTTLSAVIKTWEFPEIFQWAQKAAKLNTKQMLSTFNCGIGMILICSPENKDRVLSIVKKENLKTTLLGNIEVRTKSAIILK
jgi:phosphoribosylformylglycinamidine cyclo-ligase